MTKTAVFSEPTVSSVIREASKILHLNETHLVYENGGTVVTSDSILQFLTMNTKAPNQVFILLENHQSWKPGSAISDFESELEERTSPLVPSTEENLHEKFVPLNSLEISSTLNVLKARGIGDEDTSLQAKVQKLGNGENKALPRNTVTIPETPGCRWFDSYINWPKEGEPNFLEFESCVRTTQLITACVHMVVDQMRLFSKHISPESLDLISLQMKRMYPATFQDSFEDGQPFGEGHISIRNKLKERNKYLERIFNDGLNKQLNVQAIVPFLHSHHG